MVPAGVAIVPGGDLSPVAHGIEEIGRHHANGTVSLRNFDDLHVPVHDAHVPLALMAIRDAVVIRPAAIAHRFQIELRVFFNKYRGDDGYIRGPPVPRS